MPAGNAPLQLGRRCPPAVLSVILSTSHLACYHLPPQAFLKYAIDAQCPLSFPYPADTVVVLRTGLLRHIDRCAAACFVRPLHAELQRRRSGLRPILPQVERRKSPDWGSHVLSPAYTLSPGP